MVTADSPSIENISAKNLQEILQKLTVDEKIKPHEFWDSQPVPKLRESCHRMLFANIFVFVTLKHGKKDYEFMNVQT